MTPLTVTVGLPEWLGLPGLCQRRWVVILTIGFNYSIIGQLSSVYGHRVTLDVWIESWSKLMYSINIIATYEPLTDEGLSATGSEQTANSLLRESKVGCLRWAAMIVSGQLSLNKNAIVDKRKTMLETACLIGINP